MTSYLPGDWVAVVTARGAALVENLPANAAVTVAGALRSHGVSGFVDTLAGATGTSLTTLPAFAVAVAEDNGVRIAVRGAAKVSHATDAAHAPVTGAGVTGWAEALWDDADTVRLEAASGSDADELWIAEGAVRASAVVWSLTDARPDAAPAASATPAAAVPVGEPPAATPVAPTPTETPAAVPPVIAVPAHIASQASPEEESAPEPEGEAAEPVATEPAVAEPEVAEPAVEQPPAPAEAGSEPGDAAPVSHETLLPQYDTVAPEGDEVPYDTYFGALWGASGTPQSPPAPASDSTAVPASDATAGPASGPVQDTASAAPAAPEPAAPAPTASAAPAAPPAPPASTAPAPPAPPAPPASPAPAPTLGDHDGATISVAALRAMTGGSEAPAAPAVPTFATAEQLAKESRGRAVLSTGAQITLDKNIIVGRSPKASRVTGDMPHLVTVPSPSQDISRSHVEIRVEGTAVVAVDLNTTNGTMVRRATADPVRLHPGEPHVLLNGDVIDLGDGVTITMEDLL